nr:SpoIIIAH-like family protein [bacterium]
MIQAFKLNKRILVATGLVGLLLVAAFVNHAINTNQSTVNPKEEGAATQTSSAAAFAAYRAERNLTRQREVEYLDSIIANTETAQDMRGKAQQQKLDLTRYMESEINMETVLKTKGLTDCVVSLSKDAVNVMVNLPQLTTAQVAQVVEIVQSETELDTSSIKIIPAT